MKGLTNSQIIRFYDPNIQGSDSNGHTHASILAYTDTVLEMSHDYIQLLFPLPERSNIHPSAPVIDSETFHAFRSRPVLQAGLLNSLTRMLLFYGFEISWSEPIPATTGGETRKRDSDYDDDDDWSTDDKDLPSPYHNRHIQSIHPTRNFPSRSSTWVGAFSHHHLRMTRMIRCLRVLGLPDAAEAFYRAVASVYDGGRSGIGAQSMMYWTRAAKRPLYLTPAEDDDEDGEGKTRKKGMEFLYEDAEKDEDGVRAAKRPLDLAPEDEEEDGKGKKRKEFLYEEQKEEDGRVR